MQSSFWFLFINQKHIIISTQTTATQTPDNKQIKNTKRIESANRQQDTSQITKGN